MQFKEFEEMLLQALKVLLKVSRVHSGTVELMGLKRSTFVFFFLWKGIKKKKKKGLDSGMRLSLSYQIMKLMTSSNLSRKTKA